MEPIAQGPGGIAKVSANVKVGEPRVTRRLGESITFVVHIPLSIDLLLDLRLDKQRFVVAGDIALRATARAAEPLLLTVDVAKPRPSDITVNVSSKSIRGEVLRILAGVDGEIRRFIAQYVAERNRFARNRKPRKSSMWPTSWIRPGTARSGSRRWEVCVAQRWLFAAIFVTAALMTGCSIGKTTPAAFTASRSTSTSASSAATSSTEAAPPSQLDISQCVDVTGANADLLAASDKDAARKAADTLEEYDPPAQVKDAIEHFVSTGGAHANDPDYPKNNQILDGWVKQVCPN